MMATKWLRFVDHPNLHGTKRKGEVEVPSGWWKGQSVEVYVNPVTTQRESLYGSPIDFASCNSPFVWRVTERWLNARGVTGPRYVCPHQVEVD